MFKFWGASSTPPPCIHISAWTCHIAHFKSVFIITFYCSIYCPIAPSSRVSVTSGLRRSTSSVSVKLVRFGARQEYLFSIGKTQLKTYLLLLINSKSMLTVPFIGLFLLLPFLSPHHCLWWNISGDEWEPLMKEVILLTRYAILSNT